MSLWSSVTCTFINVSKISQFAPRVVYVVTLLSWRCHLSQLYSMTSGFLHECVSLCWKSGLKHTSQSMSAGSLDRFSTDCNSGSGRKAGNYNGVSVFLRFLECETLTLSQDDLLKLKLVNGFYVSSYSFLCVTLLYISKRLMFIFFKNSVNQTIFIGFCATNPVNWPFYHRNLRSSKNY